MRVYLPATVADLSAPAITSRQAHAATASLAAALPDEDEEGLEVSACLCAADSSVIAISEQDEAQKRYRRVVIAADVERENLRELEVDDETLPGTVQVLVDVPWDDVAAVLADEDQASADVKLAAEATRTLSSAALTPICSGSTCVKWRYWPKTGPKTARRP